MPTPTNSYYPTGYSSTYTRYFYDRQGILTRNPLFGVQPNSPISTPLPSYMSGGVADAAPGSYVKAYIPGAFSARDQKPAPRPLVRPETAGSITPTGELDLNSMRGQINNEVREVVNWIKSFSISAECNADGTITVRLRMPDFEG